MNGQTLDHPSYLVPQGTADIFFPTDFQLLQSLHQLANQGHGTYSSPVNPLKVVSKPMYACTYKVFSKLVCCQCFAYLLAGLSRSFALLQALTGKSVRAGGIQGQVMKTKAFMKRHADLAKPLTKSGYNPLLEDFSNTSFYIGSAGVYATVHLFQITFACHNRHMSGRLQPVYKTVHSSACNMCCRRRYR